ncbi:U-box domain-containing protein 33 [Sesamum alatum]|uniref:RING-type E3 ubiquitin transferase n=1 Tax=Sesamum alatum TaxID=300844 RepID=A0AAE1XW05_9LAMI|nr:U-box domain-containing protein 33 [Sesamum alatum]
MAMVEIPQPISGIRCPDIGLTNLSLRSSGGMRAETGTMEEVEPRTTSPPLKEDMMFVAVGKDVKESETVLAWALNNSRGMKICVLHVHQPAQKLPMMGTKVPISLLEEHQVKAYHENERHEMNKILDKYVRTCDQAGVHAEKICLETDSIEKGIVQLISKHGIKWLVMGAAANKCYSRKMKELKSKKAIHVRVEAPSFCRISFIWRGNLVHIRESKLNGVSPEGESPPFQASPNTEAAKSLRSHSVAEGQIKIKFPSSARSYRRFRSDNLGMQLLVPSNVSGGLSPRSSLQPEGNSDWGSLFMKNPSLGSNFSTCSSSEINEDAALVPLPSTESHEIGSDLPIVLQNNEDLYYSSMASSDIEGSINDDELYDRLEQFVAEAESSRKEAYEESIRRKKAEKDVIDAIRRAKASETMYTEELRRRREIEEALARGKEETEKMKRDLDEIVEKLRVAQEQKFSLERQIADSDKMVEELEQKMFSAVELLQKYKIERDKLQVERDNALRMAEELREKQAEEASSSSVAQFFSEFSFLEIEEATSNFSQALQIGKGGYGSIYRGNLRHTQVAIKMLHPASLQGPYEFQQEVNILSKLRHPNIVTLIGACPEAWALVYENLKDLLDSNGWDWPFVQAKQLAYLAISCAAMNRRHRPDLASEVWRVLEPMKVSCGVSSVRFGSDERYQIPAYFICPIFQEIMQEPVVAADGFTYESEALKGWLESGHDTSPMTNLKLPHCDLVPNHALRSAIQEWLQQA